MVRKFLLASVGAIALTGSALAADLPSRAPPPVYLPPPPIFTWTGIYVGGQIGYAWTSGNNNFTGFDPFFGPAGSFISTSVGGTPSGVIGGGHVGYQIQLPQWSMFSSSGVVLGLEGSVDGTSLSNTSAAVFPDGTILSAHTNADVQGSIRGRLGIAWDRALIYATGGVAFGGFNTNVSIANSGAVTGVPFFVNGSGVSTTRVGWTVGGGIEYAITNNWWVFAEYRYTNWGTINDGSFTGAGTSLLGVPGSAFFNGNRTINQNQVQVGFSYKFDLGGPPVPVVSKY
jgi:outer membrane immunogenic protein